MMTTKRIAYMPPGHCLSALETLTCPLPRRKRLGALALSKDLAYRPAILPDTVDTVSMRIPYSCYSLGCEWIKQ